MAVGWTGVRLGLGVLVLALVVGVAVNRCTACEGKCAGPRAEIVVAADVAEVTACDETGVCARQRFETVEDPDQRVSGRTFTVFVPGDDKDVRPTLSGVSTSGGRIESTQITARSSAGSCGCRGPARMHIGADGAGAVT